MKRSVSKLIFSAIIFMIAASLFAQNTDLGKLTVVQDDVKTKRVSSYDRSGGNNDRIEHILPGEKK